MALIFYLSAQSGLESGLSFDLVLRKAAHMAIYATLWLAFLRALGWRRPGVAALLTLAYAVSDELHQSTVTDRNGSVRDVGFDCAGIALAWLAWWWTTRRPRPRLPRGRRSATGQPGADS